jgi:hypothetical protein
LILFIINLERLARAAILRGQRAAKPFAGRRISYWLGIGELASKMMSACEKHSRNLLSSSCAGDDRSRSICLREQ